MNSDPIDLILGSEAPLTHSQLELFCDQIAPQDLVRATRRVYDINARTLLNRSDADRSFTGLLNRWSLGLRRAEFNRRIKSGLRAEAGSKVIVTEGDSWFEFPFFIKDIIDWLNQDTHYAIYTIASGSDWLANMIYEGKYVEELSILSPDVFLISGGGNDLVGESRLASLLKVVTPDRQKEIVDGGFDRGKIRDLVLNKAYTQLLNVFLMQYYVLFKSLKDSGKFDGMAIVTQGYDYPRPSFDRFERAGVIQGILHMILNNGSWLRLPLMMKGVTHPDLQRAVIGTFIDDFNAMLIDVGSYFPSMKIYHVDCRGVVNDADGWFDELHPKSERFARIADGFNAAIRKSPDPDRVDNIHRVYEVHTRAWRTSREARKKQWKP